MGSPATGLLHFQTAALNGRSDTPQRTTQDRPKVHDGDQGSGALLGVELSATKKECVRGRPTRSWI